MQRETLAVSHICSVRRCKVVCACETAPCARFTLSSQSVAGVFCWKSSEGFLGWYKALAVSFDREAQSVDGSDVTARGHSGPDFTLATAGAPSLHMHG